MFPAKSFEKFNSDLVTQVQPLKSAAPHSETEQSIVKPEVDAKEVVDDFVFDQSPPRITVTPRQIRAWLDEHVVGQEKLKKTIAVAVYNHYVRVESNLPPLDVMETSDETLAGFRPKIPFRNRRPSLIPPLQHAMQGREDRERVHLDKSNLLILGPTGSGKTLIAKTTADLLHVPFSVNDATAYTMAGYVGMDADACITSLLQAADYDVQKAQRGIVFLDEIDKIAKKVDSSNQRDVSGEGVQQALLRMLEGTNVNVTIKQNGKRGPSGQGEQFTVDTTNILFVCAGAFIGLDKIITDRVGVKRGSIGFGAELPSNKDNRITESDMLLDLVEPQDLIKFGFIPEFVGRLPIVTSTKALAVNDLAKVLTEPKNSIVKQYQEIFARNGIELRITKQALTRLAKRATHKKTGARGLRRILEGVLNDTMYDYFGSNVRYVVVDEAVVLGEKEVPVFCLGEEHKVAELLGEDEWVRVSKKPAQKMVEVF